MAPRISPRIVTVAGILALIVGLTAPALAQSRSFNDPRPGASEARDAARALTERRAQDAARRAQDAESRARAAEDRQRMQQLRTDQLSRPVR